MQKVKIETDEVVQKQDKINKDQRENKMSERKNQVLIKIDAKKLLILIAAYQWCT